MIPIAEFYDENMNELIRELHPDFILDCIDSIKSKKDLIQLALNEEIPIISSMGMARKKDPSQIEVCEVEKTSYDPIAKNIRIWKRKNKIRKKNHGGQFEGKTNGYGTGFCSSICDFCSSLGRVVDGKLCCDEIA